MEMNMPFDSTTPTSPVVFLDLETTGLSPGWDQPWELAYRMRSPNGNETADSWFIKHDQEKARFLPEPFYADYQKRYDPATAVSRETAADWVNSIFTGKAHLIGAGPVFEVLMLRMLLGAFGLTPGWNYRIQNIEDIVKGHLLARARWDTVLPMDERLKLHHIATKLPQTSDALSLAIGVDPAQFARHTAMGDVNWVTRQWDVVHSGPWAKATSPDRNLDEYAGNVGQTITDRKGPSFPTNNPGRPIKDNPQA